MCWLRQMLQDHVYTYPHKNEQHTLSFPLFLKLLTLATHTHKTLTHSHTHTKHTHTTTHRPHGGLPLKAPVSTPSSLSYCRCRGAVTYLLPLQSSTHTHTRLKQKTRMPQLLQTTAPIAAITVIPRPGIPVTSSKEEETTTKRHASPALKAAAASAGGLMEACSLQPMGTLTKQKLTYSNISLTHSHLSFLCRVFLTHSHTLTHTHKYTKFLQTPSKPACSSTLPFTPASSPRAGPS